MAGDVVTALLHEDSPERFTEDARSIYLGSPPQPDLRCVWTGKALAGGRFCIDHVLPFSLWRSNVLWNLLPADPAVNGKKSDRLPERKLLVARRAAVVGCWEIARDERPEKVRAGAALAPPTPSIVEARRSRSPVHDDSAGSSSHLNRY